MHDTAKITCPFCQALNPEAHRFCQQCRAILPKRYLYALGKRIETLREGELLADRYLIAGGGEAPSHDDRGGDSQGFGLASLKHNRIVLDTKPGLPPEFPSDIPSPISPYLRLFPYRIHVPQVFGVATLEKKGKSEEIWLLEQAPIYKERQQRKTQVKPQLLPELTRVWQSASPLRQLNWLWQIATLWQPFSSEGVASSLLCPNLLRVEGGLVRLLQLQLDRSTPALSDLGALWQQWVEGANPIVAEFLAQLCQHLIEGQLSGDRLVAQLDLALTNCGKTLERNYQIVTRTDKGPSRQRNEDARYPNSDTPNSFQFSPQNSELKQASNVAINTPLAIVCDGIGGHEGGMVASNLAVETIQQQLHHVRNDNSWQAETLSTTLEMAICAANDQISQRNDAEQRQQRQRMGTTVVMALAYGHEIYITHVGDSRAYWITRSGCHQVTLDDDVASREVRLGYSVYREALQQIGSGSLVQALGMGSSMNLHPTVQRFVVDEDCIFLLCSDGLSDSDRVEQFWEDEILPVLDGKIDLTVAAARLIEIGNTLNGHDNVTVALVRCRVNHLAETPGSKLWSLGKSSLVSNTQTPTGGVSGKAQSASTRIKTRLLLAPRRPRSLLPLLLGIGLLLGLGSAIAYLLVPELATKVNSLIFNPSPAPSTEASETATPASFDTGSFILVKSSAESGSGQIRDLVLFPQPVAAAQISATVTGKKIVPAGSILQVLSKQSTPGQDVWLRLKVCSLAKTASGQTTVPSTPHQSLQHQLPVKKNPTATNLSPPPEGEPTGAKNETRPLQAGEIGWIKEGDLTSFALPTSTVTPARQGKCSPGSG
ncbi:MAG TPA: serine/threonine protein phosphatase [Cyanobacteria bacterium UBA11369]|nr:serine/threonine protein phosphatase [Cyanobacteria bacterium UBA11371]HBE31408.1 serine/threonine protein phosphatase [Cyanobacteria bacterium UBA11368]HBE50068.1 serine/threonine protein phosphatase [Cyanobacteria bacterium UBA11369]